MEIKMSADHVNQTTDVPEPTAACMNMESVNRIAKLPVVESTIQTATSIYGKVKDYNSVTNWTCTTAETTVQKAIEVGKPIAVPVVQTLEGPIKKVDDLLCSGLDYVEAKVPAVKLPPGEMYQNTKDYVSTTVTPAVQTACSYVQSAKNAVEPAMESALHMVEPAVGKACAIKDYGTHKVGELLHRHHEHGDSIECAECTLNAEKKKLPLKPEESSSSQ